MIRQIYSERELREYFEGNVEIADRKSHSEAVLSIQKSETRATLSFADLVQERILCKSLLSENTAPLAPNQDLTEGTQVLAAALAVRLANVKKLQMQLQGIESRQPDLLFEIRADRTYDLQELLAFSDRQFVEVAYISTLNRRADVEGLETYLEHLRAGMSKAEILAHLKSSEEGLRQDTSIAGLTTRIKLLRLSKLPLIGRLLSMLIVLVDYTKLETARHKYEGDLARALEARDSDYRKTIQNLALCTQELQIAYESLFDAIRLATLKVLAPQGENDPFDRYLREGFDVNIALKSRLKTEMYSASSQ